MKAAQPIQVDDVTAYSSGDKNSAGLPMNSELNAEKRLIKQFQQGSDAQYRFSAWEAESRIAKMAAGDSAGASLVLKHMGLVISIARRIQSENVSATDFEDLVSAGVLGLVIAIDNFDVKRTTRLSTYAVPWIRNKMLEYARKQRWLMHIPDHTYKQLIRLFKATKQLRQTLGRYPTEDELADTMDESSTTVVKLLLWCETDAVSLDAAINSDSDTSLAEFIQNERGIWFSRNDWTEIETRDLGDTLNKVLNRLPKKQRDILKRRFGLGNRSSQTLEEIASDLNLSRERIRQIEQDALQKLRLDARTQELREFILYRRSNDSERLSRFKNSKTISEGKFDNGS